MFINHLLFPHAVNHDDEVVKPLDYALDLKAVDQMDDNGDAVLSHLIEEAVL